MLPLNDLIFDTSHHEDIPDWTKISPKPLLAITKATEGTNIRDPRFVEYMNGMKKIGTHRGAFHFFRKAQSVPLQVKNFIDTVKPVIVPDDRLILDVEEGGEKVEQIIDYLHPVHEEFPNNLLWLYSRKGILDTIKVLSSILSFFTPNEVILGTHPLNAMKITGSQSEILKSLLDAVWTAGYPNDPTPWLKSRTIPPAYIPDPKVWPVTKLWQYAENGKVQGINGAIDLNMGTPGLIQELGGEVSPTPGDIVTHPYTGVRRIVGERYGRKTYVTIFDPPSEVRVVNEYALPSSLCKKHGAQFAFNGDDWNPDTYKVWDNNYPSLLVFPSSFKVGNWKTEGGELFHSSGVRPLVEGGQNVAIHHNDSSDPKWTERHARSLRGVTANGRFVNVTVDGVYYHEGVTFWEGAEILREFGVVTGFDGGGGGDSVDIMDGDIQNVPDNPSGGINYERKVPQTILVFVKKGEDNMGTIGTTKGVAKAKTNIKTYGGILKVSIGVGDLINAYVYGTLNASKTDLIEFDHYYKANGTRVELGELCKCVTANMTITTETEPTTPTDPGPTDPPPSGTVADMPYTLILGGKYPDGTDSPYEETTVQGVVKAKK